MQQNEVFDQGLHCLALIQQFLDTFQWAWNIETMSRQQHDIVTLFKTHDLAGIAIKYICSNFSSSVFTSIYEYQYENILSRYGL